MTDGGTTGPVEEALEQAMQAAFAVLDPVPAEVVAAAKACFTWRTIDAELAALSYDSLEDADALVGVRGPSTHRALSFEYADVVIDVEVDEQGDERMLTGQVAPAASGIELHHASEAAPVPVSVDELGRFRASVRPGPIRFLCRFVPHRPFPMLLTEWMVV